MFPNIFEVAARKKGVSAYAADLYWKMKNSGAAIELHEGDRVRLNVKAIQRHPDYYITNQPIWDKNFFFASVLFLAMFWTGNLIKVVA